MINNNYCEKCLKYNVCVWTQILSKLDGTEKKPVGLEITVDGCSEFLEE